MVVVGGLLLAAGCWLLSLSLPVPSWGSSTGGFHVVCVCVCEGGGGCFVLLSLVVPLVVPAAVRPTLSQIEPGVCPALCVFCFCLTQRLKTTELTPPSPARRGRDVPSVREDPVV